MPWDHTRRELGSIQLPNHLNLKKKTWENSIASFSKWWNVVGQEGRLQTLLTLNPINICGQPYLWPTHATIIHPEITKVMTGTHCFLKCLPPLYTGGGGGTCSIYTFYYCNISGVLCDKTWLSTWINSFAFFAQSTFCIIWWFFSSVLDGTSGRN